MRRCNTAPKAPDLESFCNTWVYHQFIAVPQISKDMDSVLSAAALASMDAGAELTRMYLQRAAADSTGFMSPSAAFRAEPSEKPGYKVSSHKIVGQQWSLKPLRPGRTVERCGINTPALPSKAGRTVPLQASSIGVRSNSTRDQSTLLSVNRPYQVPFCSDRYYSGSDKLFFTIVRLL